MGGEEDAIRQERGFERRGSDRKGEGPEERAEAESWLPGGGS